MTAPTTMLPRPFRVTRTSRDTQDTRTLDLEAVDGAPLTFAAGQFTMLHAFGVGEVPISISGDPGRPETLRHTIRNVGSVSRALAGASAGTVLGVRGPFGTGWQVRDGHGGDVVFVAGGIGLAPLRPAILEVCRARGDYGRVALLYGARTPEDILFGDDLRSWGADHDIDVEVTVDSGPHAWRGNVGLVTQLIDRAAFDAARTLALICGPEVMMRHSAVALGDRGVPRSRIRLSMERNMKCGVGLCGHCQLREYFLCLDGPVLAYDVLEPLMAQAEL
ncbi:MAG TPA: FAD/NAD(P)-binding protein [Nocardioides sp.]|uniref:FAD/NAD(P)-binding protein n=1 Tax=Nocardioides sp. TaxID=35761 RepID=UPI002E320161|nr:FAD/NAD(P)-binding protein [Nocardioides sp.]HEX5087230.1 FAD/NAD(P)-binding protein [Nocardioides sp.]